MYLKNRENCTISSQLPREENKGHHIHLKKPSKFLETLVSVNRQVRRRTRQLLRHRCLSYGLIFKRLCKSTLKARCQRGSVSRCS
jgi:hypothetical protein